ncbi:MAG TPA: methyltransferase domain-containing protein [Acidimicrobiales bacterium]|nr:methyltransferase domain-containing protein [Acidimicrobiales bacterium]
MATPSPTPVPARRNIARQQRFWTRRAVSWDHGAGNNPGLVKVVNTVIAEAEARPEDHAVDLGCGSGQVTLALARQAASVLAIDVSQKMIDLLLENARAAGVCNVEGKAIPIEQLEFAPGSIDLVVSNYAFHHLRDADKPKVVKDIFRWLRPGGNFVLGDMMFGRGGDARDRQIIASKVSLLVRKGPGGWWRIAKNGGRYLFRTQERPVSMAAWVAMFEEAGFAQVKAVPVVQEAAVVRGTRPS